MKNNVRVRGVTKGWMSVALALLVTVLLAAAQRGTISTFVPDWELNIAQLNRNCHGDTTLFG